jgi:hypothetical protein
VKPPKGHFQIACSQLQFRKVKKPFPIERDNTHADHGLKKQNIVLFLPGASNKLITATENDERRELKSSEGCLWKKSSEEL